MPLPLLFSREKESNESSGTLLGGMQAATVKYRELWSVAPAFRHVMQKIEKLIVFSDWEPGVSLCWERGGRFEPPP